MAGAGEYSPHHEEGGPGRGIWNFFKRFWYNLLVVFIGGKWSLIETCTKHRKLSEDGKFDYLSGFDKAPKFCKYYS